MIYIKTGGGEQPFINGLVQIVSTGKHKNTPDYKAQFYYQLNQGTEIVAETKSLYSAMADISGPTQWTPIAFQSLEEEYVFVDMFRIGDTADLHDGHVKVTAREGNDSFFRISQP